MITIKRFIKDKILHLVELIPFARDFFLVLTKGRQDISYRGVFDTWEQARKAASRKKANDYDVTQVSDLPFRTLLKHISN